MLNQLRQQIKKYLLLLSYRWKVSIACLLAAVTLGNVYYLSVPKMYQSTVLLRYIATEIDHTGAISTQHKETMPEVLSILEQLAKERNSLEAVILRLSLYKEQRQKLSMAEVVEIMQGHIELEASSKDTVAVSFHGLNPVEVLNGVNAISEGLIEAHAQHLKEQGPKNMTVVEESDVVMAARAEMEEKEAAMAWFRLKHYNEMPEQVDSNLSRLNALREQSGRVRTEIKDLEAQRDGVKIQVKRNARKLEESPRIPDPSKGKPDVDSEADLSTDSPDRSIVRITDIDDRITHLKSELQRMAVEIEQYDKWLKAVPIRKVEWLKLEEEYEQAKTEYQSLAKRPDSGAPVQDNERGSKKNRLAISDPGLYPKQPVKPNYYAMMLTALVSGLGLALAVVMYSEIIDRSLKYAGEAEDYLGVSVVASVPYIGTDSEIKREKLHAGYTIMAYVAYCVAMLAALVYLARNGLIFL